MHKQDYIEAEDYYEMAHSWISSGQKNKAMECLQHVLELNPRFIYAYIDIAKIYARGGRFNEAQRTLKEAIHYDKKFHDLHYLMAKYAYREHDYSKAMKFIDSALNLSDEYLYRRVKRVINCKYKSVSK